MFFFIDNVHLRVIIAKFDIVEVQIIIDDAAVGDVSLPSVQGPVRPKVGGSAGVNRVHEEARANEH